MTRRKKAGLGDIRRCLDDDPITVHYRRDGTPREGWRWRLKAIRSQLASKMDKGGTLEAYAVVPRTPPPQPTKDRLNAYLEAYLKIEGA